MSGFWVRQGTTLEPGTRLLGVCKRTFLRQIDRYVADGLNGLIDKRLEEVSHRRAGRRGGQARGSGHRIQTQVPWQKSLPIQAAVFERPDTRGGLSI